MKLTTAKIRELIREELQKINEYITNKYIRKGKIIFNGTEYVYYVFIEGDKGLKSKGNVKAGPPDNLKATSYIGHARVSENLNDPKSLWNKIKDQEEAKNGKFTKAHTFVIGYDESSYTSIQALRTAGEIQ